MYLYETHLHTSQSSRCSITRGRDYIKRYKDLGYSGIIITDHFYNGNTAVEKKLKWRKWVEKFCIGYEEAKNEGIKRGLDVFFGWESTFLTDDYLIYGLDKEWLLEHPDIVTWSRREQHENVKRSGGCVVQAHPFRQHYYISTIYLCPSCIDAVEAGNAGNEKQSYDALAMRYAKKLGVAATAGTDMHNVSDINGNNTFGVYFDKKLTGIHDYVKAIRENNIKSLHITQGRCDFNLNEIESVELPVNILDADDNIINKSIQSFLKQ